VRKFNTNGTMIGPLIHPHPLMVAPAKTGKNGGKSG
jgi:hypothetical protein